MLCRTCAHALQGRTAPIVLPVLNKPLVHIQSFSLHSTVQGLRESARDGCFICRNFWAELKSLVADQSESQKSRYLNHTVEKARLEVKPLHDEYGTISISLKYPHPGGWKTMLPFSLQPLSSYEYQKEEWKSSFPDKAPSSMQYPRVSNTSSKESLEQADAWLRQCVSVHSSCNKLLNSNWFPNRVLEIGGDSSTQRLRLICTAEEPLNGRYLTLSHCWGKGEFVRLLRSNIEEFRRNIPFSSLPKTFQDAITVAQRFGIRYMWIDSLCILQDKDDLSDWYREAGLMQTVYSCSYLNIAASAAADGSQGLFRDRDPSTLQPEIVEYRDPSRIEDTEPVRCILVSGSFWARLLRGPLNKRGWVFQERLLAPRVLHFGRSELAWECCEFEAAETFPCGIPGSIFARIMYGKATKSSFFKADQNLDIPGARDTSCKLWGRIVSRYSSTVVTVSTDKLVAISGVAKKFREILSDDYIAGMWLRDLPRQLMWYTWPDRSMDSNALHYCLPSPYRAPTWSWASVDTAIYMHTNLSPLLTIQDIQLNYATDDTTGAIKGGHIDLKGTLLPFDVDGKVIGTLAPHSSIIPDGYVSQTITIPEGSATCASSTLDRHYRNQINTKPWPQEWRLLLDDLTLSFDHDHIWCLLGTLYVDKSPCSLIVLLLEVVDAEEGIFRRIGLADVGFIDDRQKYAWMDDLRVDKQLARRFPCRKYVEEEEKHVVRVI